MKVVILAGGYGTRIAEESDNKPKPMVEIGEMPILLHIMNYYSYFGHNEFIICCGYKRNVIEEFFKNGKKEISLFEEELVLAFPFFLATLVFQQPNYF